MAPSRYLALADPIVQWPRTPPFHGGNTGSNPVRVAGAFHRGIRASRKIPLAFSDTFRTVFAQLSTMDTKPKARRDRFPIIIKRGSCAVRIYRDRKLAGTYYRVCYHIGGKRERLNFSDLDKAKLEAEAQASKLSRGDVD